jgi:predicted nuclease of predicted toxin-antitoxin system
MRLLLDECMPRRFARGLAEHHVATAQSMGWRGIKNGALLNRARREFDVFITVDRGIPHEQNLAKETLSIIVLRAWTNDVEILMGLLPKVREVLTRIQPGEIVVIE